MSVQEPVCIVSHSLTAPANWSKNCILHGARHTEHWPPFLVANRGFLGFRKKFYWANFAFSILQLFFCFPFLVGVWGSIYGVVLNQTIIGRVPCSKCEPITTRGHEFPAFRPCLRTHGHLVAVFLPTVLFENWLVKSNHGQWNMMQGEVMCFLQDSGSF